MVSRVSSAVLLLAFLVAPAWTTEHGFLQRRKGWVDPSSIQGVLNEVLGIAHGVESSTLSAIEAKLSPLFTSLPKVSSGRVSRVYMKLAVQRYFRQTYGWRVNGFETNSNTSHDFAPNGTHILESQVPEFVEKIIEKNLSHKGFTLQDVVIAIATVERLIKNEVVKDVEVAFDLNGIAPGDLLSESSVSEVLSSYYIVEHLEGNSTNRAQHKMERTSIERFYAQWPEIMDIIDDMIQNDAYKQQASGNPFAVRTFVFEDVVRMAQLMERVFGPFANQECHMMKDRFSMMDVYGTGRVKLSDFYKATPEYAWQFLESEEYMNSVGSLDYSSEFLGPQLIIANHIVNNCLSPSTFFKVCCLNECDGIFQHLEASVKKPTASAAEIARAIEGGITASTVFSSSTSLEPRNLSAPMRTKLLEIAEYHKDAIPLHGRLLAQWLHFAFPRECPFPHLSSTMKTPDAIKKVSRGVEAEKVHQLLQSDVAARLPSPEAGRDMWSLDEELPEPFHTHSQYSGLRIMIGFVMAIFMVSVVLNELARAMRNYGIGANLANLKVDSIREHYV